MPRLRPGDGSLCVHQGLDLQGQEVPGLRSAEAMLVPQVTRGLERFCKCGCGVKVRYAYAPGHRPVVECARCSKSFTPLASDGALCSQCRRHVRDGAPMERDGKLIHSRKMQAQAPEGRRWCGGCNRYRLVKFFNRHGETYYSRCKPCQKRQQLARRAKSKYGISIELYDEIKEQQGGKCAICQVATGAARALAIDHDHSCCSGDTSCGKCVRGVLCGKCNSMLGFAGDDPTFFQRAIDYLRQPPAHTVIGKVKPE